MMPNVVLALRSLASWKRSFFWLEVVDGDAFTTADRMLDLGFFSFDVCLEIEDNIGHCDSLLCRVLKHRPIDGSKLHCNRIFVVYSI